MDEKQFIAISSKMDTITKLLALNFVQGKTLKEQVSILSSFGFVPKQIAEMLGKTQNNVNVTLHELRKSRKETDQEDKTPSNLNKEKSNG